MAPLLAALALAAPIHVERNLHYGRSDQQTLDAYVAPGARRAVVLIHGGGWHSGSKESLDPTALRFAQSGWTAFSISYRLVPPAPWYAAKEDALAAAAASWSGPMDLATFTPRGVIRRYAGCACPDRLRALSPVSFIGAGDAPFLLVSSTREIVLLRQATDRGSRHAVEYEREAWQPTLRFLASRTQDSRLPAGFRVFSHGPAGGEIWRGTIPGARRASMIYVPPGYSVAQRYPVVYLLAGMPGSPWSYVRSLSLASVADTLIARGLAVPFVAVMPPAGRSGHYDGEWAGPWERFLVRRVLPWTQAHLAVSGDRTIAGLSAGGYGAVDIALRHPRLFRRVESWGGYFRPFRDGPLREASAVELAAHDPSRLVRADAQVLRSRRVRFFLSTGPGHGRITAAATLRFARLLRGLGLQSSLERIDGKRGEWEQQLVDGLRWAFGSGG